MKGTVTIRWYGSSNGYYSESVSFYMSNSPLKKEEIIVLKSFDESLGKNILYYLDLGDMFVFIFSDYSIIGFIQYYHGADDMGFEVISEFDLVELEIVEKRINQLKQSEINSF